MKKWTQDYKEQLEQWISGTEKTPAWIKDYKEYHTDAKAHFVITLSEQQLKEAEKEGLEKKFKLTGSISTSNLVCFDLEGRIRKYDSVNQIIHDFFDLRKEYYQKRKEHMLKVLTQELSRCENKVRFVKEIIAGTLIVNNRKKKDLLDELKQKKYDPLLKGDEFDEEGSNNHGYDYLLSMPIWNLTMEKVENLLKEKLEKEKQVKILIDQTALDLWRIDLNEFLEKWDEFEMMINALESQKPAPNKKAKKTVGQMIKKTKKYDSDITLSDEEDYAPKKKKAAAKKNNDEESKKVPVKLEVASKKVEPKKETSKVVADITKKKPAVAAPKKRAEDWDSEESEEMSFSEDSSSGASSAITEEYVKIPNKLSKKSKANESDESSEEVKVVKKPIAKRGPRKNVSSDEDKPKKIVKTKKDEPKQTTLNFSKGNPMR